MSDGAKPGQKSKKGKINWRSATIVAAIIGATALIITATETGLVGLFSGTPRAKTEKSANENVRASANSMQAGRDIGIAAVGSQNMVNSPGGMQAGRDIINVTNPSNENARITGVLKPREPGVPEHVVDSLVAMSYDGRRTDVISFHLPDGVTALPFGRNVPFWITKTPEGLLVSAEIRSMDGKIIAELINNEWRTNPHNYFKLNYDGSALEIIDDYNIPWLQIDYVTATSLKVGGIFRSGNTVSAEQFPSFTNPIAPILLAQPGPGGFLIIGSGFIGGRPEAPALESDAQKQAFADDVREKIQPWFDYTPSKGLGVRVASDKAITNPLTVQIPTIAVSGTVSGRGFKCDKATIGLGGLALYQGDTKVTVENILIVDMKNEGVSIPRLLVLTNQESKISVELEWKEGLKSKMDIVSRDFVMRLEFSNQNGNRIPGKIYLESRGRQQTKIAGTFEAEVTYP